MFLQELADARGGLDDDGSGNGFNLFLCRFAKARLERSQERVGFDSLRVPEGFDDANPGIEFRSHISPVLIADGVCGVLGALQNRMQCGWNRLDRFRKFVLVLLFRWR